MLYLNDKGNVWSWVGNDLNTVCYEDGTQTKLTTNLLTVEVGKHKGTLLSEITDRSYLEWMLEKANSPRAGEPPDAFIAYSVKKRLQEMI